MCVTSVILGKLLDTSEPQFPHLLQEENGRAQHTGLDEGVHGVEHFTQCPESSKRWA